MGPWNITVRCWELSWNLSLPTHLFQASDNYIQGPIERALSVMSVGSMFYKCWCHQDHQAWQQWDVGFSEHRIHSQCFAGKRYSLVATSRLGRTMPRCIKKVVFIRQKFLREYNVIMQVTHHLNPTRSLFSTNCFFLPPFNTTNFKRINILIPSGSIIQRSCYSKYEIYQQLDIVSLCP